MGTESGRRVRGWVASLVALLLPAGAAGAEGRRVVLAKTETSLGRLPEKTFLGGISPDGRRLIAAGVDGGCWAGPVFVNGEKVGEYEMISDELVKGPRAAFSEDGRRYAFAGQRASKQFVVVDGREGKAYGKVSAPGFSPQGKHVVYVAWPGDWRGGEGFVVLDGVEGTVRGRIGFLALSPDGERLAYGVWHDEKRAAVVVDGKEGKEYEQIDHLAFSPDGKRLVYAGKRGDRWRLVLDGVEGPEHEGIWYVGVSPNGQRVTYTAKDADGLRVVVDGVGKGPYEEIEWVVTPSGVSERGAVFSADSRRVVFRGKRGQAWHVGVDGVESRAYEEVRDPVLSADGRRVVYAAKLNGAWRLVVDGFAGEAYDGIGAVQISPDGQRIACVAQRGDAWCIVVDGVVVKTCQPRDGVGWLSFSPDGRRVAYSVKRGEEEAVFVDGVEIKGYLGVLFPPDGRHVVCLARTRGAGDGQMKLRVGEAEATIEGTEVYGHWLRFTGPQTLLAVVERRGEFVRVQLDIQETP